MTCEKLKRLRMLSAAHAWTRGQTRPDVAAEVSMIQSAFTKATAGVIVGANKVVRRLTATDAQKLVYANIHGPTKILACTDAVPQNMPLGSTAEIKSTARVAT